METLSTKQTATSADFRRYLQEELVRRIRANPKYSLRSFARRLGIDPSLFSKILRGKIGVTRKMFDRLAKQLDLDPNKTGAFRTNLKKRAPVELVIAQPEYRELSVDMFQVIADWTHYAVLELTHVKGFQENPKWIAARLGISVAEVNAAIERLTRLEMLEIKKSGRWKDMSEFVTNIQTDFTSAAHRRFQVQILAQAQTALEETPIALRDQSSMTMAVNLNQLPQLKEKIKNFRRELCAFVNEPKSKDEVYQFAISLFPISRSNSHDQ